MKSRGENHIESEGLSHYIFHRKDRGLPARDQHGGGLRKVSAPTLFPSERSRSLPQGVGRRGLPDSGQRRSAAVRLKVPLFFSRLFLGGLWEKKTVSRPQAARHRNAEGREWHTTGKPALLASHTSDRAQLVRYVVRTLADLGRSAACVLQRWLWNTFELIPPFFCFPLAQDLLLARIRKSGRTCGEVRYMAASNGCMLVFSPVCCDPLTHSRVLCRVGATFRLVDQTVVFRIVVPYGSRMRCRYGLVLLLGGLARRFLGQVGAADRLRGSSCHVFLSTVRDR